MAIDKITGNVIADGAIDHADKIATGVVIAAKIGADAVGGTKLADNAVNSEHITAASIDTAHIADDQVTGAKIENNPSIAGNLTVGGDLVPATPLSSRNMIINGGMQVWQRQTAATAATGYTTVDRFWLNESGDGAYTSQKYDMSVAELNTTGHRTALQLNCTTADASVAADHYAYFFQRIEAQDLQHLQYGTAAAKTITLSFWVKSNKTGVYCVDIEKKDSTAYFIPIEYTISSANTWEKKVITITPTAGSTSFITSAAGVIDDNTDTGLEIAFGLKWGSNYHGTNNTWTASSHYGTSNQVNWMDSTSNNFYITGVQLELGSNATPFEHHKFTDELRKCQRYFYVIADQRGAGVGMAGTQTGTSQPSAFANVSVYHTNVTYFHVLFPVMMRAAPTYENTTGTNYYMYYASGNSHGASGFAADIPTMTTIRLNNTGGSLPGTTYGGWWQTNNAACFMAVKAEL